VARLANEVVVRVSGIGIAPLQTPQGCGTRKLKIAQRLAHPPSLVNNIECALASVMLTRLFFVSQASHPCKHRKEMLAHSPRG